MPLKPGLRLGPYEVLAPIGAGGMGEVYRARDTRLGREVAVKVLPSDKVSADRLQRFLREAQAASQINHPNVVAIHDIAESRGVHFIVMELVAGQTLADALPPKGFAPAVVLDYARQIAASLAKAHACGTVHRDLKPANIMVTADGVIKILDFGLAKLREPSDASAMVDNDAQTALDKTMPGMILGTAAYMSPEQAEGRPADARSDIFSLGLVLYEMLTGQRAFREDSAISTMAAILHKEPRPLKEAAPQTPPELERVVTRCLRKQPEQRFQSAVDLRFALEDLQGKSSNVQGDAPDKSTILEKSKVDTAPSLAVLPFANLSADKDNEYFSDGLAEEIINAVSQVPGLRVTARSSAFSFRGKDIEMAEIGRKLGVEHLLEGSVRKAGSRIRVTVQLVKAADSFQVWSERYDREMTDVFAVQDEIAQAVVEKLKGKLSVAPPPSSRARHSENLEAYSAYMMGRHAFLRTDRASVTQAKEHFERAVELDPGYALAYVGMARCSYMLTLFRAATLIESRRMYEKALELDGTLADARAGLGHLRALMDYDWKGAEREFQQALATDTVSADCLYLYGEILWAQGRFEEALAAYERAKKLEPVIAAFVYKPGAVYQAMGEYEKALRHYRKALEIDSRHWIARAGVGWCLTFLGRPNEALQEFAALREVGPPGSDVVGLIAANVAAGRTEKARQLDRQFSAASPRDEAVRAYWFGENDRMFEVLHRMADERNFWVFTFTNWTVYRHLYPDPRFQSLLRKLNLPPR
jgi:eukaryotic-like serine/threonine-protein kinase